MSAFSLTGWDLFAVAIILISSIMAFARGLMREVFSIVAFIAAAAAALYARPLLSPLLKNFVQPALMAELLAALVLFLVVFVIVTVATSSLAKFAHKSGEIGALDPRYWPGFWRRAWDSGSGVNHLVDASRHRPPRRRCPIG